MGSRITNKQIYEKLVQIEGVVKKLVEEEEIMEKEGTRWREAELKELQLLKKLQGKDIQRTFDDIVEWKQAIWDNCPDKERLMSKKTVDYRCKKTGKNCRFIDCYRNKEE